MMQVRDATAGVLDNHSLSDALRHRQSTGALAMNFDI
jgi:hypothetical protein